MALNRKTRIILKTAAQGANLDPPTPIKFDFEPAEAPPLYGVASPCRHQPAASSRLASL